MNLINVLLLSTLILKVMSVEYPAFYALDIEDGQGSMLLSSLEKNCPFYSGKISMYKNSSNEWQISNGVSYTKPSNGCPTVTKSDKLLFTLPNPSTLPASDGWYNVTKAEMIGAHNETVTLNLRKVEACRIYTNAYFKFSGTVSPSTSDVETFEQCQEKAIRKWAPSFFKNSNDYFLFSSRRDGKKTVCTSARRSNVQGSILEQTEDQEAKFAIVNDDCISDENRNLDTEEWITLASTTTVSPVTETSVEENDSGNPSDDDRCSSHCWHRLWSRGCHHCHCHCQVEDEGGDGQPGEDGTGGALRVQP